MTTLPDGPLVAWYGDDFTGSTDALEVLTWAGLESVLFLGLPTPEQLAPFAGWRGIGIAGTSRSRSPEWMDEHLPPIFRFLAATGAPILQYKVCSTFDSSPTTGSIGRALDLGLPIIRPDWSPLLVAAPRLRRFQAFGNLFALVDGEGFRLDRHPTMSRHPVTPMREADLRRHLALQTDRPVGLVDLVALGAGSARERLQAQRKAGAEAIALDVIDDATLRAAGELVWEQRGSRVFGACSSGLEYALVAHWQDVGLLPPPPPSPVADPVEHIVVVSGSCSPTTAGQIAWSVERGFRGIRLDVGALAEGAVEQAVAQALRALDDGADPIVYAASGPDDPAIGRAASDAVGETLALVLRRLLDTTELRRAVVAGGDSSGAAAGGLGITALTALAPLAPGSPLCRAVAGNPVRGGLELALKGGQVGGPDYFAAAKAGRALN